MRTFLGGVLGKIPRPTPAMVVALLALFIAASGTAVAAISFTDANGNIRACADNRTGALRVLQSTQNCTSKETAVNWVNGLQGSQVADSAKLGGQLPSAFLGANGKAADSEKLDGMDSTDFAKSFKRTVVVSPVGTDTENGTTLLDALNGITDASATKPYLIYIEPGTYDLGSGALRMKQYVDIQGAGETNTIITSSACAGGNTATVVGADNAELRFFTVRNAGTVCSAAILNDNASPRLRLTHVTVEATGVGQTQRYGVVNRGSSPTMTDVTVTASGSGGLNYAVLNSGGSSPTMTDVTATASGVNSWHYGVANFGASPLMTDVTVTASEDGDVAIGVDNHGGSSPTIRQSKLSGIQALSQDSSDGTTKIALTQVDGGISSAGTLQCFNNYNRNMSAYTCP